MQVFKVSKLLGVDWMSEGWNKKEKSKFLKKIYMNDFRLVSNTF